MRRFTQGFTAEHDGYGFRLHSGVLMAANLVWTLVSSRERYGRATFPLELPFAKNFEPLPCSLTFFAPGTFCMTSRQAFPFASGT
ncbi:MAG: hypothetical protein D6690_17330 [Nitrospirae bacterium]|nr:MAG: hypothetical protein D6690_17330 [Nitrospirota bacterium]